VYATGKDALNIDGCGDVGVRTLMSKAGVVRLSDLFALTDFGCFKTAQAKKVKESLELAKSAPLWRKIAALNIDGIGKVSAQDMASKYGNIAKMYDDAEGLKNLIGEVDAANFKTWIEENIEELDRLVSLGFKLQENPKSQGPLSGKSFCITGRLISGARDDISALIEKYGGTVKGTVTKKCGFLVQGSGGGANKAAGSAKWGTRLISEEELFALIGIPMPESNRVRPENIED
jgi:DNA ligase (NAD+)